MAWTTTNPVSIGGATKKSDYDKLWDNCDFLKIDHNTDGTHEKLTVGSDADGDMYYRASGVLARLAKGTANHKLFTNAGATAPEWAAGMVVKTYTREMSADNASVALTGVGFKPSAMIICGNRPGDSIAFGFTDGVIAMQATIYGTTPTYDTGQGVVGSVQVLYLAESAGVGQVAYFTSWDTDGVTLAWVKAGSPASATGYYTIFYFR